LAAMPSSQALHCAQNDALNPSGSALSILRSEKGYLPLPGSGRSLSEAAARAVTAGVTPTA
jgi:hypothetical protein